MARVHGKAVSAALGVRCGTSRKGRRRKKKTLGMMEEAGRKEDDGNTTWRVNAGSVREREDRKREKEERVGEHKKDKSGLGRKRARKRYDVGHA